MIRFPRRYSFQFPERKARTYGKSYLRMVEYRILAWWSVRIRAIFIFRSEVLADDTSVHTFSELGDVHPRVRRLNRLSGITLSMSRDYRPDDPFSLATGDRSIERSQRSRFDQSAVSSPDNGTNCTVVNTLSNDLHRATTFSRQSAFDESRPTLHSQRFIVTSWMAITVTTFIWFNVQEADRMFVKNYWRKNNRILKKKSAKLQLLGFLVFFFIEPTIFWLQHE